MKREEEIQKLIDQEMGIDNYGSCDFQIGVIYGVKHADKTMIEKIRIWVTERYDLDFMGDFKDLLDYIKSLQEG
jgi:hypothetical protein